MIEKSVVLALSIVISALCAGSSLAGTFEVSPQEYALYKDYLEGRADERLATDDEETKLKKIAKTLGVNLNELKAAIEKVKVAQPSLNQDTVAAIRASLEQTPLAARVLDVELNTDTRHAVAYVKWRCPDKRDVDLEAAYVAWAIGDSNPLVNVLGLWCVNEIETKLFSAQIGREAFTKIRKSSIPRFAASRYIRFFQKIKRGPHL